MNNSKHTKYFLLAAVIIVWTMIIFRVIRGLGEGVTPQMAKAPFIRAQTVKIDTDSFILNADYPDPFLDSGDTVSILDTLVKTTTIIPAGNVASIPVPPKEPISNIVRLNGIISNPQIKSKVAVLTILGQEYLVKEGDKAGDVRVKKIGKDIVIILYKGEIFTIGK